MIIEFGSFFRVVMIPLFHFFPFFKDVLFMLLLFSCFQGKTIVRGFSIFCLSYYIIGCAPLQIKDDVFSPVHKEYTAKMPRNGWNPLAAEKEDLVLWNKRRHATIAFISNSVENNGPSPEMLSDRLFLGIKNKKIILRELVSIDNQSAVYTILTGKMGNYPFKIASYVVRIGNRVYDFACWAPSDLFDSALPDFDGMVKSLDFL